MSGATPRQDGSPASAQDTAWAVGRAHRETVFAEYAKQQSVLLDALDARLRHLAWELPQRQNARYPLQLAFFLCNGKAPCTHCPHPQWLRWIPNPKRLGRAIPARVVNPGRVLRGNPDAMALYTEARKLIQVRGDVLTAQTGLTRKVAAQFTQGVLRDAK